MVAWKSATGDYFFPTMEDKQTEEVLDRTQTHTQGMFYTIERYSEATHHMKR